jgi:integrase
MVCRGEESPLRPATAKVYRIVLQTYAAPLHRRPVTEIRRRDIAELLRVLAKDKGPATAALVRSVLSRLWGYLLEIDAVDANVAIGTPVFDVEPRARTLTDGELRALWHATEEQSDFNMCVRLMLWCGVRRSEAGGAMWREFSEGVWVIPPTRTKNHRELKLPLARQAIADVARWPKRLGRDHLFGASSARGFTNFETPKARLDERLGFARPWVLHDIRRTCESKLAELGIIKEVRARLLNHDVGAIDLTYQKYDFAVEKKQALQAWADTLETIVGQPEIAVLCLNQV